jgi:microcystin degradation protein MlrC
MARIAVGGFQHETNTFAPLKASWADFERADAWPPFVRGPGLIEAIEGFNIPIAGAVPALQALGHELVPLCSCSAPPSSYVEREAYEKVAGWIIEDLQAHGPVDAVYLDLHGAMVAEHFEDGEGELMRRVRAVIGERVPLVASLDYHTNMTPEMVRHASAMVGYRTYPHIDMAETGGRAARLLDRMLKDRRPLHKAYRRLDFLIPLVWQCTLMEPAKGIFELIGEIERGSDGSGGPTRTHNQGIVSITHTPGFPPADIAQCGPALVVYGHDKEAAEAVADRLASFIKQQEAAFAGRLYTPDEAVVEAMRLARSAARPILLADIQDNPGAGGTSDTVGLLRANRPSGAGLGDRHDCRSGRGRGGDRRRRRRGARARHWRCGRLCRRETGRKSLAGRAPRQRHLHRVGVDVRRRQVPHRADGAPHGRSERRLGGARLPPHSGGRPGDVPPCRGRAV